ncbi:unnamed protein product, partial [Urochloa humidicola]
IPTAAALPQPVLASPPPERGSGSPHSRKEGGVGAFSSSEASPSADLGGRAEDADGRRRSSCQAREVQATAGDGNPEWRSIHWQRRRLLPTGVRLGRGPAGGGHRRGWLVGHGVDGGLRRPHPALLGRDLRGAGADRSAAAMDGLVRVAAAPPGRSGRDEDATVEAAWGGGWRPGDGDRGPTAEMEARRRLQGAVLQRCCPYGCIGVRTGCASCSFGSSMVLRSRWSVRGWLGASSALQPASRWPTELRRCATCGRQRG